MSLAGVAEQFALAEAAMNAWSTEDVESQLTSSTIPLQGKNPLKSMDSKLQFYDGRNYAKNNQ